jgi:hypothetical protein
LIAHLVAELQIDVATEVYNALKCLSELLRISSMEFAARLTGLLPLEVIEHLAADAPAHYRFPAQKLLRELQLFNTLRQQRIHLPSEARRGSVETHHEGGSPAALMEELRLELCRTLFVAIFHIFSLKLV